MATITATRGVDIPRSFTGNADTLVFLNAGHANTGDLFNAKGGLDVVRIAANLNIDLRPVSFLNFEKLSFSGAGTVSVNGTQLVTGLLGTTIEGAAGIQTLNIFALADYSAQALTFTNWDATDTVAIYGSSASQTLEGSTVNDTIYGGAGDDIILGRGGNDTLYGEAGNDKLGGISGDNVMYGGSGNDSYWINSAGDIVNEIAGEGTDTVYASDFSYVLGANVEDLMLFGSQDLNGTGNGENNFIRGNDGSNRLEGLSGDDTLRGLAGNDFLEGGTGKDALYGDAGADTFVFATGDTGTTAATADRILDFSSSQGDLIDLTDTEFSSFIGSASFTGQPGEVRAVATPNGQYLVQGDADGDGLADFALVVDSTLVPLTTGDFIFG